MRLSLLLLSSCTHALQLALPSHGSPRGCCVPARAGQVELGLFDGVKGAFGAGDKPLVGDDRVTPFDRWLGLDKGLDDSSTAGDATKVFIDPNDTGNYLVVQLTKPMGIAFVENAGNCGGLVVDEVLSTGSAASGELVKGDQLVAVDDKLLLGFDFDAGLEAIQAASGETTRLVFFRGPTTFLYGPTKPAAEWYTSNLL